MDYHAKEEMVVDQFLLGMGNHELSVQVAAHGHKCVEDILRVAQSLEAVQEDEKFIPEDTNPAHKHVSSQTSMIIRLIPSSW